jgi:hypothetical protein
MTELASNQRMGLSFVLSTMMIDSTLDESVPLLLFLERVPIVLRVFFFQLVVGFIIIKEHWQGKTINIGTI